MPTYCFTNAKGETIERNYRMADVPGRIRVGRQVYERDFCAEHNGQRSGDAWTNHWSLSMGATTEEHAREIGEKCAAAGVDCQFDKSLRLKVNSKNHQKQLAKVIFPGQNVRNLDSYY